MHIPEVEVQNLNSALSSIREHMPEGLICEEVTISKDLHRASWLALCTATDDSMTPRDSKNCILVKRILQMSFGKYGVVRRVQTSIHKQPDGDVSYKWQVFIDPRYPIPKTFGVYLQETLRHFKSTSDQTHN